MAKKKSKKINRQARREATIRFELEQLRRKQIKKKKKKKLTPFQLESKRRLKLLRKLEKAKLREPIRRFIPKKPTVMKQLESFKVFGKVPIVRRPIVDEASRKDVRSAEEIEFLEDETFMFSDDLLGTEEFVPKRIEDL